MEKSYGVVVKESLVEVLRSNFEMTAKSHKVMKRKVKRYVTGRCTDKEFIKQLGVPFLSRFIIDAVLAMAICKFINISYYYVYVYAVVRVMLFANNLIRAFIDECSVK